MSTKLNAEGLAALRMLARRQYHAGYTYAALMDDGGCLCIQCLRENYRQVFKSTRDTLADGWTVFGHLSSGETDEGETCAHCNCTIWEDQLCA
jgi:hypothetical protein